MASGGREKATIRAVAARANVAVSTVSRVLNGGYASDAARGRVRSAIQELGYMPSVTAQSLVTGRAGCIGVVSYTTQTSWFSKILSGIEESLANSRRSILLSSLVVNGRYDSKVVADWIAQGRVDGLIFVRYTRREQALFDSAHEAALPVVLVGPDVRAPAYQTIRCNNIEAGRLVAEHLLQLGHHHIAFAGGPRESIDTRDRLRGLSSTLSQRGAPMLTACKSFGASYAPQAGTDYARAFLALQPRERPTAVVLGNDAMALGFMREVLQEGVKVPEDVSVVGFDGIAEGSLYWPGVTTVHQPAHRMGSQGCQALLDRLTNPETPPPGDLTFDVELVVRESTAPPPRRE